jgi:ribosomal protein S18 acetylase RimI-like enzyme
MRIRSGNKRDLYFIRQMLFEACFWNPKTIRLGMEEFFTNREISKLVSGWGRTGDRAVIAEINQDPVGAAWFRLWTESDHSYGYISSDIPELGMGIVSQYRSRGIGRKLLRKLIALARNDGFTGLSLSVDPANFARKLYESEGFVKVGESSTSWTYKLEL